MRRELVNGQLGPKHHVRVERSLSRPLEVDGAQAGGAGQRHSDGVGVEVAGDERDARVRQLERDEARVRATVRDDALPDVGNGPCRRVRIDVEQRIDAAAAEVVRDRSARGIDARSGPMTRAPSR